MISAKLLKLRSMASYLGPLVLLLVAVCTLPQISTSLGPSTNWPVVQTQILIAISGFVVLTVGALDLMRSTIIAVAGMGLASIAFQLSAETLSVLPGAALTVWFVWLATWTVCVVLGTRWLKRTGMPIILVLVAAPLTWLIAMAGYSDNAAAQTFPVVISLIIALFLNRLKCRN